MSWIRFQTLRSEKRRRTSVSGLSANSGGNLSSSNDSELRTDCISVKRLDAARVRLEYVISFCRVLTSAMLRGNLPRDDHRSTWNERVALRLGADHPKQWRVGDDAAIPIMLTLDLNCGKCRRQRAAGHDMLRPDVMPGAVKGNEIAGPHVDGADTQSHRVAVDTVEIDELLKGALQFAGVIVARRLDRALGPEPRRHRPKRKKTRRAGEQDAAGGALIEKTPRRIAFQHGCEIPSRCPEPHRSQRCRYALRHGVRPSGGDRRLSIEAGDDLPEFP